MNLTYISETDAEILPFSTKGKNGSDVIVNVLTELGLPSGTPFEEREFERLFARLTRVYEGANERSKLAAEQFSNLRKLLEENLEGIRVLVFGETRVTIVIAGYDIEGAFTGVRTSAVET